MHTCTPVLCLHVLVQKHIRSGCFIGSVGSFLLLCIAMPRVEERLEWRLARLHYFMSQMGWESMVQPMCVIFILMPAKSTLIIAFANKDDVLLIGYYPGHHTLQKTMNFGAYSPIEFYYFMQNRSNRSVSTIRTGTTPTEIVLKIKIKHKQKCKFILLRGEMTKMGKLGLPDLFI